MAFAAPSRRAPLAGRPCSIATAASTSKLPSTAEMFSASRRQPQALLREVRCLEGSPGPKQGVRMVDGVERCLVRGAELSRDGQRSVRVRERTCEIAFPRGDHPEVVGHDADERAIAYLSRNRRGFFVEALRAGVITGFVRCDAEEDGGATRASRDPRRTPPLPLRSVQPPRTPTAGRRACCASGASRS